MDTKPDIHKAGGILLKDGKFLVTRAKGNDTFISPGGKPEPGETIEETLKRELKEELNIEIDVSQLETFGTFFATAAGEFDRSIQMEVFIVPCWTGDIAPSGEVEEILWIDSNPPNIKLGSIFEHDVLPELKARQLIN